MRHCEGDHCLSETQGINVFKCLIQSITALLLPLLHLHNLIPVEAPHLELPVEVPDGERDEVLVCDPALSMEVL